MVKNWVKKTWGIIRTREDMMGLVYYKLLGEAHQWQNTTVTRRNIL